MIEIFVEIRPCQLLSIKQPRYEISNQTQEEKYPVFDTATFSHQDLRKDIKYHRSFHSDPEVYYHLLLKYNTKCSRKDLHRNTGFLYVRN